MKEEFPIEQYRQPRKSGSRKLRELQKLQGFRRRGPEIKNVIEPAAQSARTTPQLFFTVLAAGGGGKQ